MDRETKQNRKRHREELIAQRMREDAARQHAQDPKAGAENPRSSQGPKGQPQPSGKPRLPE